MREPAEAKKHRRRNAGKERSDTGDAPLSDVDILSSIPGIGPLVLAVLLGEASDVLERRDLQALRRLTGVAPVTKSSGKSLYVARRLAVHHRLQQAVHHWAAVAVQHDPISRAKYAALRRRGHRHTRALRSVGDRLLLIACTMLKNRTMFDPGL